MGFSVVPNPIFGDEQSEEIPLLQIEQLRYSAKQDLEQTLNQKQSEWEAQNSFLKESVTSWEQMYNQAVAEKTALE